MLWMMVPCMLLVGFLFWGGSRLPSSVFGYLWVVFIGVFFAAHIWMMFKGHGSHDHNSEIENKDNKNK